MRSPLVEPPATSRCCSTLSFHCACGRHPDWGICPRGVWTYGNDYRSRPRRPFDWAVRADGTGSFYLSLAFAYPRAPGIRLARPEGFTGAQYATAFVCSMRLYQDLFVRRSFMNHSLQLWIGSVSHKEAAFSRGQSSEHHRSEGRSRRVGLLCPRMSPHEVRHDW